MKKRITQIRAILIRTRELAQESNEKVNLFLLKETPLEGGGTSFVPALKDKCLAHFLSEKELDYSFLEELDQNSFETKLKCRVEIDGLDLIFSIPAGIEDLKVENMKDLLKRNSGEIKSFLKEIKASIE